MDPRRPAATAATVLFDSEEPHLYSMALRDDGEVIVGAGGGHAVVYGLGVNGRPRVIARLGGDEVKGLAVAGEDVVAIANEFSEAPEPPRRTVAQSRTPTAGGPTAARARPGRGNLYRIRPSGLAERVYATADSHLSAVQWDARRREIWLGLGVGGRVLAVGVDRTVRVVHDVDESGVTALSLTGRARVFGTADTAAFYVMMLNGYFRDASGQRRTDLLGGHLDGTGIIVVFKPVVLGTAASGGAYAPAIVEQMTLVHEFGHAVGLVDDDVAPVRDHADRARVHHCTSTACVMNAWNEGGAAAAAFAMRFSQTGAPLDPEGGLDGLRRHLARPGGAVAPRAGRRPGAGPDLGATARRLRLGRRGRGRRTRSGPLRAAPAPGRRRLR